MNAIHSIDGLVVRTMHRKCNYDPVMVNEAHAALTKALGGVKTEAKGHVLYYKELYEASNLADVVILPYIRNDATALSNEHLEALLKLCEDMLMHKPFELVTIHDQFNASPSNVDHVRYHYKETVADLAKSNILDDIFSQLLKQKVKYQKLGDISDLIRNSAYALC
jgi:hypothetical protein